MLVVGSPEILQGKHVKYNLLAWRSYKLNRVCRSSLSAEAQSCSTALDEVMMTKTLISLMVDPNQDPRAPETARRCGQSVLVVDAKGLFDAVRKPGFTSQQDKRAAIDILCIQQKLQRLSCQWKWVSSERRLADGMTKMTARQAIVCPWSSTRNIRRRRRSLLKIESALHERLSAILVPPLPLPSV